MICWNLCFYCLTCKFNLLGIILNFLAYFFRFVKIFDYFIYYVMIIICISRSIWRFYIIGKLNIISSCYLHVYIMNIIISIFSFSFKFIISTLWVLSIKFCLDGILLCVSIKLVYWNYNSFWWLKLILLIWFIWSSFSFWSNELFRWNKFIATELLTRYLKFFLQSYCQCVHLHSHLIPFSHQILFIEHIFNIKNIKFFIFRCDIAIIIIVIFIDIIVNWGGDLNWFDWYYMCSLFRTVCMAVTLIFYFHLLSCYLGGFLFFDYTQILFHQEKNR